MAVLKQEFCDDPLSSDDFAVVVDTTRPISEKPIRLDAFIVSFCRKGRLDVTVNMQKNVMKANSFFMFSPTTILEVKNTEEGHTMDLLLFTREFFEGSGIDIKSVMPSSNTLWRQPTGFWTWTMKRRR